MWKMYRSARDASSLFNNKPCLKIIIILAKISIKIIFLTARPKMRRKLVQKRRKGNNKDHFRGQAYPLHGIKYGSHSLVYFLSTASYPQQNYQCDYYCQQYNSPNDYIFLKEKDPHILHPLI